MAPAGWLPPGKRCAICFSIDDLHPARSSDGFEAGGDLADGVLGNVLRLAARHPELRSTLCVTPDWRPRSPFSTRPLLAALGGIAKQFYLSPRWPEGKMRLDRHPEFCRFLGAMSRVEIVPHGLHHVQKGPNGPAEFERAHYDQCRSALRQVAEIMSAAGLDSAPGHCPPCWVAPPPLRQAMADAGLTFVASARDIRTPVQPEARTAMSGMNQQPLIFPGLTAEGLVHIPINFQATNDPHRAFQILEAGGLLSVKAHAVKQIGRYTALDGLDAAYTESLDALFAACRDRFGDGIWWATMGEIAGRFEAAAAPQRKGAPTAQ